MEIRNYQPGDEAQQAAIYNEAAEGFPGFKPATADDVRRRCQARDFDPSTRFVAVDAGRTVGYTNFYTNGRISFPWCRMGHEAAAEPLIQHAIRAMKERGLRCALAAYRGDWTIPREFFLRHGFKQTREIINFVLDVTDMPTRPSRRSSTIAPLERDEVPAIYEFAAPFVRSPSAEDFAKYLFSNPYFQPDDVFVARHRTDEKPVALGLFVFNPPYADPKQVDPLMPCFRHGAFGTEGLQTKRINGLFSFLTRDQHNVGGVAKDLLGHAAGLLEDFGGRCLAAQVPSDAPHFVRFYTSFFRRQGSFPVFEQQL